MKYPDGMVLRPLQAWPRELTRNRRRSPFRSGWSDTIDQLGRELNKLGTTLRNAPSVLQIALREQDFRLDGMPRASAVPEHPGVILNIETAVQGQLSFPCDAFDRWQDNLRAITLALEALRKVDRYGITPGNEQYTGWRAIDSKPAAPYVSVREAMEELAYIAEVPAPVTPEDIPRVYRRARAIAHPDRNGGDRSRWDRVELCAGVLRNHGRLA